MFVMIWIGPLTRREVQSLSCDLRCATEEEAKETCGGDYRPEYIHRLIVYQDDIRFSACETDQ